MNSTNHGVLFHEDKELSGEYLMTYPRRCFMKTRVTCPINLQEACQFALANELTHLWIMPNTGIDPTGEFAQHDATDWSLLLNWNSREDEPMLPGEERLLSSVTGWRRAARGGQKQITIIFPAQSKWSWAKEPGLSPQRLLTYVDKLESRLHVAIAGSPSSAGANILKQMMDATGHPEWLEPPDRAVLASVPWSLGAKDIHWRRELTEEEQRKGYLVKVDGNMHYFRACVETKFGQGTPYHVVNPNHHELQMPGLWCISVNDVFESELLPPLVWSQAQWVATPIVKMLKKYEINFVVHEGTIFPQSHQTLKAFAERLWAVRQEFRGVIPPLADATKEVAVSTLGLFGDSHITEKSWKYRPDWLMQLRAEAWANMHYKIRKYAAMGHYPCIVWVDSIFFVTDSPNVEECIPGLLDHQGSLGGLKCEYALSINDEVRSVLNGVMSLPARLSALNKLAEQQLNLLPAVEATQ